MSDRNYYWLAFKEWFIFTEEEIQDMDWDFFHVVADPNGISKDLVVVSDGS